MNSGTRPRLGTWTGIAGLAALLVLSGPLTQLASAADPVVVTVDDGLSTQSVTVAPGTSITWVNADTDRHRLRSVTGPEGFDTGNLDPGEQVTISFTVEGEYSYVDDRDDTNSAYHGTVIVSSSGSPGDPAPPPATGQVEVNVADRLFLPATISVAVGATIRWTNNDDRAHTVTANDGSFDSGVFDAGGTYQRTFSAAGTFSYFCVLHPDMVGTITVGDGGGGEMPPTTTTLPPPPSPPPAGSGDVSIFDNGYTPGTLTVAVGSTVTWANDGALPHTVTDEAARFDSGMLTGGQVYSTTFDSAGTFNYFCSFHPEMRATVVVSDGAAAPPPAPPPVLTPPPGGGEGGSSTVSGPTTGDVTIVDSDFAPGTLRVGVGARVTWVNTGSLPHTVTGAAFDSGLLMSGDSYSRTFPSSGTFAYVCTIHPGMEGTVVVGGGGGEVASVEQERELESPPDGEGTEPAGTEDASPSLDHEVAVIDLDYDPRILEVPMGSTVHWVNEGALPHTVTLEGLFDSGLMSPGDRFEATFDKVGSFAYVCTLHPGMEGTILVSEPRSVSQDAGSASTPSPGSGPRPASELPTTLPLAAGFAIVGFAIAFGVARVSKAIERAG